MTTIANGDEYFNYSPTVYLLCNQRPRLTFAGISVKPRRTCSACRYGYMSTFYNNNKLCARFPTLWK